MEKLKPVYEAKGYTCRTLAKAVGTTAPIISYFNKDIVNPTPRLLKKILAELDCPAQAVITPGEFDYELPAGNSTHGAGKPDKRTNPCRLQTRTDIETDFAFRALCYEEGKTVSDKLLELVRAAVAGMEGAA